MSDTKRFASRRAMLRLGVAGLAGGMPPLVHAASRAALDHLAYRLEALAADGLDPRHYDLPENIAMRGPADVMARAEAALRDLVLGRVATLPGRADIKRDPARADFPAWRERLLASTDPASVLDQAAALHPDAAPITAELARQRQLEQAAFVDPLTGLANKAAALRQLRQLLLKQPSHRNLAVVTLDVDGFQGIHDSLGIAVGHQVLIGLARPLRHLTVYCH